MSYGRRSTPSTFLEAVLAGVLVALLVIAAIAVPSLLLGWLLCVVMPWFNVGVDLSFWQWTVVGLLVSLVAGLIRGASS